MTPRWPARWVALVLLDAVAVATFARCFAGPSELWLLVPLCIGAQFVAHGARLATAGGGRLAGAAVWLLAALLVAWVPVLALDISKVSWGLPIGHGATVLAHQLSRAWYVFSVEVSPVSPEPGLVLAAAWASGAMALAAEALDSDPSLPVVVALVPAFDIVVFTGTLGTSTGRALELAALGAISVWFLASSVPSSKRERIVVARVDERSKDDQAKPAPALSARVAAPGLAVLAALAAGVVGPLLPGATSRALVAWHGQGPGSGSGSGGSGGSNPSANGQVIVSSLVQVGEEEVDNPDVVLATVHSSVLTREVLETLDDFNGNQWFPYTYPLPPSELPALRGRVSSLESRPPPVAYANGLPEVTQVITVAALGNLQLLSPGPAIAVAGPSRVLEPSRSGPLIPARGLSRGQSYAVEAYLNPPPSTAPSPGGQGLPGVPFNQVPLGADFSLPAPVPQNIVQLAHSLVRGATTPQQEALDIQDYFTENPAFRYSLPRRLKSGIVSTGEGYAALEQFLFKTRVGYCQQYASAFAVLARVDGLPTRVAVGLLPGAATGADSWVITGQDAHAWPQVYFSGIGWSDFEPTPGAALPPQFPVPALGTTPPTTSLPRITPTTLGRHAPNLRSAGRSGPRAVPKPRARRALAARPAPGGWASPLDVLIGVLSLGLLWALAVPSARLLLGRRRRRDPAGGVLASWRGVLRVLAAAGYHRRRTETYSEFAQRVRLSGVLSPSAEDAFRRLVLDVNRASFGRGGLPRVDIDRAVSDARAVRKSAWRRVSWRQRLVAELDPRDLLSAA